MSWVKRNLYFLVGSVVAVALLGLAGYYCYSKWSLNKANQQKLNSGYDELRRLTRLRPNPGNEQVDNIANARQQRTEVLALFRKERRYFTPVPPIPDLPAVNDQDFSAALRRTVDELQHEAAAASVALPPDYYFSFKAERHLIRFAKGSPPLLAEQLGVVKAICEVLFKAKVNALDAVRRTRVSADDQKGAQQDYLNSLPVTNTLAIMTPYEVTFHCFSGELASVLSSFANQPHGFLVKSINVGAGTAAAAAEQPGMGEVDSFGPEGRFGAPPAAAASQYTPKFPATKGGLPIVLEETKLTVTLRVEVVKLLPIQ